MNDSDTYASLTKVTIDFDETDYQYELERGIWFVDGKAIYSRQVPDKVKRLRDSILDDVAVRG